MQSISLPKPPKYQEIDEKSGQFIIEGCYPGYGTTLGNSLRRVLLSSLPGCAAVSVKIKGVTHEFTTLKGVMEDMVQIILNLKHVRFRLNEVEEATIFLKIKGEKEVTAKDFKSTSEIEVINIDQHIATLASSSAVLDMEVKVNRGLGYVPAEQQEQEEKEIGTIAIDAVYTPIKRVNFNVENMRVGKRTDYDRITLEVFTDGSITPQEAYNQAVETLMAQVHAISEAASTPEEEVETEESQEDETEEKPKETKKAPKKSEENIDEKPLDELKLSTRILNVLKSNDLERVSQVAALKEEEVGNLEGMGQKGIKEVKKAIGVLGVTLKSN